MIDITHKSSTLRTAVAEAKVVVSREETIDLLLANKIPKGNVFEMAKTAGLFGVKKTAEMIPDCHPLPVECTRVDYSVEGLKVTIQMEVKTIYKTGVEVEAMHGVSVVALTMYDMLKPVDKGIEIRGIRLVKKKGGKSDFKSRYREALKARVVVCSDTISAGKKEDKAGLAIIEKLEGFGVEIEKYSIIADEKDAIVQELEESYQTGNQLLIYTGGTGLSPRDITPESIEPLLDRRIPGIEEAIRQYGQLRTPYSMLSRSVAGEKDGMLVLALPGSTNGASESIDAIFPAVLHVFGIMKGKQHE